MLRPRLISENAYRTTITGRRCTYCGEPAEVLDHWPPAVHTPQGVLLPCCSECNTLASDEHPANFYGRVLYVKGRLRKRYRKALNMPQWEEEELEVMSPSFRTSIRAGMRLRLDAAARIEWDSLAYLATIDTEDALSNFIDRIPD